MKVTCGICEREIHLVRNIPLHEVSYKGDPRQLQEEDKKKYGHKAVPIYHGGIYS